MSCDDMPHPEVALCPPIRRPLLPPIKGALCNPPIEGRHPRPASRASRQQMGHSTHPPTLRDGSDRVGLRDRQPQRVIGLEVPGEHIVKQKLYDHVGDRCSPESHREGCCPAHMSSGSEQAGWAWGPEKGVGWALHSSFCCSLLHICPPQSHQPTTTMVLALPTPARSSPCSSACRHLPHGACDVPQFTAWSLHYITIDPNSPRNYSPVHVSDGTSDGPTVAPAAGLK